MQDTGFDKLGDSLSGGDDSDKQLALEKAHALYEQLEDTLEPLGKSVSDFCAEMDQDDEAEDAAAGGDSDDSQEPGDSPAPPVDNGPKKALLIAMLKKKK